MVLSLVTESHVPQHLRACMTSDRQFWPNPRGKKGAQAAWTQQVLRKRFQPIQDTRLGSTVTSHAKSQHRRSQVCEQVTSPWHCTWCTTCSGPRQNRVCCRPVAGSRTPVFTANSRPAARRQQQHASEKIGTLSPFSATINSLRGAPCSHLRPEIPLLHSLHSKKRVQQVKQFCGDRHASEPAHSLLTPPLSQLLQSPFLP